MTSLLQFLCKELVRKPIKINWKWSANRSISPFLILQSSNYIFGYKQLIVITFYAYYLQQKISWRQSTWFWATGTPPLTRFFRPGKNSVKGKPRYRRSILVLKLQNGEYESSKSIFSWFFHLLSAHNRYIFWKWVYFIFNIQCLTENNRKQYEQKKF